MLAGVMNVSLVVMVSEGVVRRVDLYYQYLRAWCRYVSAYLVPWYQLPGTW